MVPRGWNAATTGAFVFFNKGDTLERMGNPVRITHIRPSPGTPLAYRLCLALHCRHDLDSSLAGIDLMTMSRPAIRELLATVERTTRLSTGALEYDSRPEEDPD